MWSSLSEIWQEESDPLTGSRQLFPGAHYHPLFSQRAVGVEVCRVASTSGARIPRYFRATRPLWHEVLSFELVRRWLIHLVIQTFLVYPVV